MKFNEFRIEQIMLIFKDDSTRFNQFLIAAQNSQEVFGKKFFYSFSSIVQKSIFYESSKKEFMHKIGRVFQNPFVTDIFDDNSDIVWFKILSAFKQIQVRATDYCIYTGEESGRANIEDPVIKALLMEKILFFRAFESIVTFSDAFYFFHSIDFYENSLKQMGFVKKWYFKVWHYQNGYFFTRFRRNKERVVYSMYVMEPKSLIDLEYPIYESEMTLKETVESFDSDNNRFLLKPFYPFLKWGLEFKKKNSDLPKSNNN